MSKTGPIEFFRQTRAELKKITWPTRSETIVSTIAVFIMVAIAATFLFFADQIIAWALSLVLSIGQ